MRGILFLIFLLFTPGAAVAQANPLDCKGTGCCCNRQAGGDWPDCAKGYECRGQTGPPYAQVCVKKGASPLTVLSLRPSQPAKCELPASARKKTEPKSAGTGCVGAGCCCNQQAGGAWPDCTRGFECRRQTDPPHMQVCVKKGARASAPLQLRPGEPAKCVMPAARRKPGKKRSKEPEARGGSDGGHPLCASLTNSRNRQLCNAYYRINSTNCKRELKGVPRRECLRQAQKGVENFVGAAGSCGQIPECHKVFGDSMQDVIDKIRKQR